MTSCKVEPDDASVSARVVSVNVSAVRSVEMRGAAVSTGIYKQPVGVRLALRGVNLDGDDQADRNAHGGPVRALYAYASEDYRWWEASLGRDLTPGTFGENLTTAGIDVSGAIIGERWRVGATVLRVTSPRVPCFKLAHVMGDPAFVKRFAQALRPGAYLAVVEEGDIGAGDAIAILSRPAHGLTLAEMARIYFNDRGRLAELLVPDLPGEWREWVAEQLSRRESRPSESETVT